MKKIHFCDDFMLEFRRKDAQGVTLSVPEHEWGAVLHTVSNYRYQQVAFGCKGGVAYGNFEVRDNGKTLLFVMDKHGLDAGRLFVEWFEEIPDSTFSDGYRHIHRSYKTDVELVHNQGDEATEADVTVVMPYIAASLSAYALKTEVAEVAAALDALSEEYEDERILPFSRIVETLDSIEDPVDGEIVYVSTEKRFRKYEDGEWLPAYEVVPYNNTQHGISVVNTTRLYRIIDTGSLYRGRSNGLESVAWSDDLLNELEALTTDVSASLKSLETYVSSLETDVNTLETNVEAFSEECEANRILPFAGIVYSTADAEATEGAIYFVESLGVFRKYEHGSWDFNTTVSPYNLSQNGTTIVNPSRLFKVESTGSLYRKATTGNRLESVAWSDDCVTHDQLTEVTDALSEAIDDMYNEFGSLTTEEIDAATSR